MAANVDLVSIIDHFMQADKTVLGVDQPYAWADGYSRHEKVARFPLEVEGEQPGARLEIVGFPNTNELRFRISLCFQGAICRLDYTDEYHQNSLRLDEDGIPYVVNGPHYHTWRANRRFFKGVSVAPKLHNAEVFRPPARTFDAILRWFCNDTRINGLGPNHLIELPRRETLL
jgi:hypothetical protein